MSDGWYLTRNGQQYGPYSSEQFRRFAAEGRLTPNDLVASVGGQQWLPASAVPELVFSAAPPVMAEANATAGRTVAANVVGSVGTVGPQPMPEPRRPLDAAMGIAVVMSCIFWLFVGGPIFLTLTGIIWLAAGLRIAVTGGIPDTRGRLHRRSHYRVVGIILALLGLLMGVGQLAMLIG